MQLSILHRNSGCEPLGMLNQFANVPEQVRNFPKHYYWEPGNCRLVSQIFERLDGFPTHQNIGIRTIQEDSTPMGI